MAETVTTESSVLSPFQETVETFSESDSIAESKSAAEWLQQGIEAAKVGRKSDAITYLRYATEKDPNSEMAWLWLAGVTDQSEKQIPLLEKVLQIKPGHKGAMEGLRRAWFQCGVDSYKKNDVPLARSKFESLLKLDPRHELGLHWMANLVESPVEAVFFLEKVLTVNPKNERVKQSINRVRLDAAKHQIREKKNEQAKQFLRHVLDADQENVTAWLMMASIAQSAQDAIPCLKKVLEINPDNREAEAELAKWNNHVSSISMVESLTCPICASLMRNGLGKCTDCGCHIDWDHVEAIWANDGAKASVLEAAISDYQAMMNSNPTPLTAFFLTLALVNAKRLNDATTVIREAIRKWPKVEEFPPVLQQLLKIRRSTSLASALPATPEKKKPLLMVIDDSATVRKAITLAFEQDGGFEVISVESGYDAFKKIKEKNIPDLIILDVMMPGVDGYDVMKLLRSNPQTKVIPVIMLTGKTGIINKMKGKFAGATAYLTKPINVSDLLETVRKTLQITV